MKGINFSAEEDANKLFSTMINDQNYSSSLFMLNLVMENM
jgi:hypothetical protein